jgi:hypothetical protein
VFSLGAKRSLMAITESAPYGVEYHHHIDSKEDKLAAMLLMLEAD